MTSLTDHIAVGLRGSHEMTPALVNDIPEDAMARQFGAIRNHAAWQLGHIVVATAYAAKLCGSDYAPPRGWADLFKPGTEPTDNRARYPLKAALLTEIDRVCDAVEAALPSLDAPALAAPFPEERFRSFWPTLADGLIFFTASHYSYHLGQLSAWRRAMDLPKALPG